MRKRGEQFQRQLKTFKKIINRPSKSLLRVLLEAVQIEKKNENLDKTSKIRQRATKSEITSGFETSEFETHELEKHEVVIRRKRRLWRPV